MKKTILAFAILALVLTGCPNAGSSESDTGGGYNHPLIINHLDTSLASFTASEIQAAAALNIYLERASVGGNISDGLDSLEAVDSSLSRDNIIFDYRGNPGARAKFDLFYENTTDNTAEDYHNPADYDVLMTKLCYIDDRHEGFDNVTEMFEYYRDRMNTLESAYPGTVFVWWTIPLNTGSNGNKTIYNTLIRNYCENNNKILFDIAAVESHEPDGTLHTDTNGDEALFDDYASDRGHLNSLGAQRVATAFWVLAIEISKM